MGANIYTGDISGTGSKGKGRTNIITGSGNAGSLSPNYGLDIGSIYGGKGASGQGARPRIDIGIMQGQANEQQQQQDQININIFDFGTDNGQIPIPKPKIPNPEKPIEPPPDDIVEPFSFGFNFSPENRKKKGKAYIAFLKRRGTFEAVSKPTTLKAALDIGAKSAISTLGATFEVKPAGGEAFDLQTGGEFQKYGGYFRPFRIKKGQRQQLPDMTFIQKRGTRLGSIGEIMEIQKARRVKMFG